MRINHFNGATIGKISTCEIAEFLDPLLPEADDFIIKPNWYSPHPGSFSTASVMRQLFEAIDGRIIVLEGYSLDRQDGYMKFHVKGEEVTWSWLMENGWEWAKEPQYLEELRLQDEWFLKEYGFRELFREHGVEYINISEEVWGGRVADPHMVGERVKKRYGELTFKEIYGFMPEKLLGLEGSPLISLGKIKGARGSYPSLSVKNLFGLIPDPLRAWWHGPGNCRLDISILDIMRLYESFFHLYGICDGVEEITVTDPEGELKLPWGRFRLISNPGVIGFGRNLVELDSVMCGFIGVDPLKVGYLCSAVANEYTIKLEKAKRLSESWLNLDS